MDPKILEKNTLLHKVSQTAHPEIKKGSTVLYAGSSGMLTLNKNYSNKNDFESIYKQY
jgi:hypothetical protein